MHSLDDRKKGVCAKISNLSSKAVGVDVTREWLPSEMKYCDKKCFNLLLQGYDKFE